jgi:hypothetical protein
MCGHALRYIVVQTLGMLQHGRSARARGCSWVTVHAQQHSLKLATLADDESPLDPSCEEIIPKNQ